MDNYIFSCFFFFSIKFLEMFVANQLHAHGGYLAKFQRRMLVMMNILLLRCQSVKSVTSLMQQSFHVSL